MKPAHPLFINHEVPGRERLRTNKRQHLSVHLWSVRLHEIINERIPPLPADMQEADRRIKANLGDSKAHLTFKEGV